MHTITRQSFLQRFQMNISGYNYAGIARIDAVSDFPVEAPENASPQKRVLLSGQSRKAETEYRALIDLTFHPNSATHLPDYFSR